MAPSPEREEKITIDVGKGKTLIYEPENDCEFEREFIQEIKTVAKTNPGSIQEFFTRLADLQRAKTST